MGRKIQGKHHRGVKNPYEQAARRMARVANKIDRSPAFPDKQEIPKSLQRIMDFRNKLQEKDCPIQKKRNKIKGPKLISTTDFLPKEHDIRDIRSVRSFGVTQKEGESEGEFLNRMNDECHDALLLSKFETNFKTRAKMDTKTGEISRGKKCYNVEKINEKLISSTNQNAMLGKHEILSAKRVARKEIKKDNEEKKVRDFSDYKDDVKFGEVVMEPPNIHVKPKSKIKINSLENRPGQKDLLLKTILHGRADKSIPSKSSKIQPESLARKKMLEEERKRVVNLYRELKSKK